MISDSYSDAPSRAWLDVDLDALLVNARDVTRATHARLVPMVKANAYGLGAVPVARALRALSPWGFGVATVEEGVELRSAGFGERILVSMPHQAEWTSATLAADLTPLIGDFDALDSWIGAAGGRPFHVAIDSGMHRAGFAVGATAELDALASRLSAARGWEGICTHFHSADSDRVATRRQWEQFQGVVARLGAPELVHADNSAATLHDSHSGDLARPGIYLYGGRAGTRVGRVVARFHARVLKVFAVPAGASVSYGATWTASRPVRVATVAVGYADGVPRALSGRGQFTVARELAPIRGVVTMDMTMIEVGPDVRRADVATVFGDRPTVQEQAAAAHSIDYELLTGVGPRVTRRYLSEAPVPA